MERTARTTRALVAVALLLAAAGCDSRIRVQRVNSTLEVAPAALDFGPRAAGSVSTLTVAFKNSGSAPLTLTARLERDARGSFATGAMPTRIEAGTEAALTVTYLAPETEGADGVSLVIESDSLSTAQIVLSVSGRTIVTPSPLVEPVPDAGVVVVEASPDAGMPTPIVSCPGAPPTFAIPSAISRPELPRLAWNGSSNLLTRVIVPNNSGFALEAVTLSQSGSLGTPTRLIPDCVDGRVAFTGAGYGLLGWRWIGFTGAEVVFARLNAQGALVPGSERGLPHLRAFQTDAALAWDPLARQWGVLWHEWDNGTEVIIRFARLTDTGALVDNSLIELGPGLIEGSGSMLVWGEGSFVSLARRGNPEQLRLIRIDAMGFATFAELAIGARFHAQNVAWNGLEFGLSWMETLAGIAQLKFARVSASGTWIAGSTRTLQSFPFAEIPTADLVSSGTGWLATWSGTPSGTKGHIFVARLDAAGELEGGVIQLTCGSSRDGFPVASTGGRPTALAFTRFGANGSEVHTALIP